MPVRSLNSVVFKWPDRETVLAAARRWAVALRQAQPSVRQVLCVGSCARGNWGVGSDLDAIVVLSKCALSPAQRYAKFYPAGLPVPADLWVYTQAEWDSLPCRAPHVWRRIEREMTDLTCQQTPPHPLPCAPHGRGPAGPPAA